MKIAFIIGTRPEIIKMAPIIDLTQKKGIEYVLIHTGQHYDHEMSQKFFLDLEIEKPHYNIGVGSNSHGKQTAQMMEEIEKVLTKEKPDVVMVQGDTNAVLAGAVAASKLNLSVGHVEAGLRSFDRTMPEEINRKIADSCSTMYFVPTEESALNLAMESIDPHEIFITGNTVVDACIRHLKIAEENSNLLRELDVEGDILTLTMHRAENVDDPERLKNILDAIMELEDITVVFPVHPRTLKTLENFGYLEQLENSDHIKLTKPIGYLDFLLLLSKSKFVMTDSGGLQEEAITLNVPCITLRYNTERPETVTAGGNILVGSDKTKIIETIKNISNDSELYKKMQDAKNPYGDGSSSEKILEALLKFEKEGKLDINSPDNIMNGLSRSVLMIEEDVTVKEYETIHPDSRVQFVLQGEKILFPSPELNLKHKQILLNTH
ncbi:MAG: UDP-N-acetylglucosamine 2-epimerase (non-hydrolyzing) [Methanobacterium sp. ERen5]|nr:MAG: UDP-N-acetylglucosamine 2-epimerase (non-hydrolyzing) [Methanobacterium sp. ERen5]